MKQIKSNCEMCEYYLYDEEYDYYYCDMELDEDEMYDFVTLRRSASSDWVIPASFRASRRIWLV